MFRLTALISALTLSTAVAYAEEIKVGVTPGEHAEIMEEVAKVAAPKGLEIDIVEFSDYVVPNQALADGDLQANSFQHLPYLENQMKDRGFDLIGVATTILTPMGIYADKLQDIKDVPEGAKIAIPNDPTNGGRALLILQDLGLLKLNEDSGLIPSQLDITENPKKLVFVELDAAQLPRALADADAAIINTNYAIASGLDPKKDAIAMERTDSPYVNLIVVRTGDKNEPWVKQLVEAYHSAEVKKFIEDKYDGAVLTSW